MWERLVSTMSEKGSRTRNPAGAAAGKDGGEFKKGTWKVNIWRKLFDG